MCKPPRATPGVIFTAVSALRDLSARVTAVNRNPSVLPGWRRRRSSQERVSGKAFESGLYSATTEGSATMTDSVAMESANTWGTMFAMLSASPSEGTSETASAMASRPFSVLEAPRPRFH